MIRKFHITQAFNLVRDARKGNYMRHLVRIVDFSNEELLALLDTAKDIISDIDAFKEKLRGRIMASLFYEPSTRTKLSFDAAMMRLGGQVIGYSDMQSSSIVKGETLEDTIRTVSRYSDVIVMRHFIEGTPHQASKVSLCPVINAGDGKGEHPTQTLTDLLTIRSRLGRLENLELVLCGDLKNGRTVHSLVQALSRFTGNKFHFVAPASLKMPDYIKEGMKAGDYKEYEDIEDAIRYADVLYMTRVQRERFEFIEDYFKVKDAVILNKAKLHDAKDDMIVMHPLPRVNEIDLDVDEDKRAVYFEQVEYGMYVRMALLLKLVRESDKVKLAIR